MPYRDVRRLRVAGLRARVAVALRARVAAALRVRVADALRADAERLAAGRLAAARPPSRPPLREALRFSGLPLPEPLFLPPPVSAFTVAQARRAASLRRTPRPS